VIPFRAGDGFQCNLIPFRASGHDPRAGVAGARCGCAGQHLPRTRQDHLVDLSLKRLRRVARKLACQPSTCRRTAGRSIKPVYDHPVAVKTVLRDRRDRDQGGDSLSGLDELHMSALAGLVPQVKTIVSNAVSLHPDIPWIERVKSLSPCRSFRSPRSSIRSGAARRRCGAENGRRAGEAHTPRMRQPVCQHASFTYGTVFQCSGATRTSNPNARMAQHEFAHVPMTFFQRWIGGACGHLVSVEDCRAVGDSCAAAANGRAIRSFRRRKKHLLSPESQQRTHDFSRSNARLPLAARAPVTDNLDVFIAKTLRATCFPHLEIDDRTEGGKEWAFRRDSRRSEGVSPWWTASRHYGDTQKSPALMRRSHHTERWSSLPAACLPCRRRCRTPPSRRRLLLLTGRLNGMPSTRRNALAAPRVSSECHSFPPSVRRSNSSSMMGTRRAQRLCR